jgi:hypothetical protein
VDKNVELCIGLLKRQQLPLEQQTRRNKLKYTCSLWGYASTPSVGLALCGGNNASLADESYTFA